MKDKPLTHCPFCKGKAKRKSASYNINGAYGEPADIRRWFSVYCTNCLIGQPKRTFFTREESDNAWNTRY